MTHDYPALFAVLLARELKAKYKNTFLGYLWSILMPMLQSLIFFVVFSVFLRFEIADYFLFLSVGFVVWQFFSNSLSCAANSLVGNANLVKKTMVSREIFVATAVSAELVHLLASLPVLTAMTLICRRSIPPNTLYVLPAALAAAAMLAYGLGLMLAAGNAYFRDLERIVQVLLQAWFYCTPVFYGIAQLPEDCRFLLKFNPMFYPVALFRNCFYARESCGALIAVALAVGALACAVGSMVFRRFSGNVAEWM